MSRTGLAVMLPALAVLATGCVATRDWVNTVITKERIETGERVGKVEQRVDDEGRRITESGKRVDALDGKVKTVEETSVAARDRADGAMTKAGEVDGRLTRLWATRHKRSIVDSTNIRFGFDKFDLDDGAQTALVPLVEELKKNPALAVALEGYTDPVGTRNYNLELSRRRVESVQRYLVGRGVELWRINTVGLGPLEARNIANAEKRRVTVTLTVAE